jgi:hypothetical protein
VGFGSVIPISSINTMVQQFLIPPTFFSDEVKEEVCQQVVSCFSPWMCCMYEHRDVSMCKAYI